jgi:glycosyltransferase involved in cell wall biosynthesis
MRAADGFVLSSLWEGLPMGLLEAGACGLPAVATNVPGTSEVIVDGQTGLLATAGNATGLASAMNRLMRMPPEERNAMGDRARQLVTERYSLDQVLDRWEALYETRLVGNPRPLRWGRTN